ncbi:MAG: GAF domain-containing protein, partial [Pirellulaceae bacterium]
MRGNTTSPQIDAHDKAWSEIETLVDETARLARRPISSHEFHRELVKRLVQATNARSAAIWVRKVDRPFSIEAQIGSSSSDVNPGLLATRSGTVVEVARSGQPASLLPHQSAASLQNSTDDTIVLHPADVDGQVVAVVEVFHDPNVSPTESKNTEQLIAVFADLIAEFHRNSQLRELRHGQTAWSELELFVDHVHRSLDLKRTAFAIANEAAHVTGCDRVLVFHHRDAGCRTLSINGLDSFDRRSTQIRAAEQLAKAVTAIGEPLWWRGEEQSLPEPLERSLQTYLDSSHVRSLAVVPLGEAQGDRRQQAVGVLLFERFESTAWNDGQRRRIEFVCRHAATALRNANELTDLPLIGASRFLQRCLRLFALQHLPKTAAIFLFIAVSIAAFVFVPATFEIRGEGQLVPVRFRHVFAPADGVIDQLHVRHAESVMAGTPLLEVRRTDLEYEEARVLGEVLTNQKRLDGVRSALLNQRPTSGTSASDVHELTSEEARLQILLASLREQQTILERERAALSLVSPIDGEVLTWGLEDALSVRPVRRGERLLSIADPRGPWELELRIADHDIEHLLAARKELETLDVRFILASHAGTEYRGTVQEIAMATELDEHDQPTVLVRVAIDREQLTELRPGARVVANVYCGRRSIGYVWLRELIDVIKT